MGLEWMEKRVTEVPEEMKAFVDSFRKGEEQPAIKDLLHLSIYDEERIALLPKKMKETFGKYITAKEEELELCSSPFVHPEEKGDAKRASGQAYKAFSDDMCQTLHIDKHQQEKRQAHDFSEGHDVSNKQGIKF